MQRDGTNCVFQPLKTKTFWTSFNETFPDWLYKEPTAANYFYVENRDGQLEKRYLEIIDHYIVSRKSIDKEPLNYLDLRFVLLYTSKKTYDQRQYFTIILNMNPKWDILINHSQRLVLKWRKLLMKFCVGMGFKHHYNLQPTEYCGEGAFGEVYLAKPISGGTLLDEKAIKKFNKTEVLKLEGERVSSSDSAFSDQ